MTLICIGICLHPAAFKCLRMGQGRYPRLRVSGSFTTTRCRVHQDTSSNWYSHVPQAERARIRSSLRSRANIEHWSAFFELYSHELLRKTDFTVEWHHPEATGRAKDFRASRDNVTLDVEAVVCTDSDAIRSHEEITDRVLAYIDERAFVPGFRFSLEIEQSGKNCKASLR